MNTYALVILAALLIDFLLRLISSALNLSGLRAKLPAEFHDVYDAEKYRNSQNYVHALTRFQGFADVFNLVITLGFWFLGGFRFLDQKVRAWEVGPILEGLLYIGVLAAAMAILSIPLNVYRTFVIEERFGFNKTTAKTFIFDLLKGIVLTGIIGGCLLAAILGLFQHAGQYAWLWCWMASALFALFLQCIAPTWIMPLFNRFTPLEEGELREAIESYAATARFPLQNIFVMDGSKRSSKSNAFICGFGKYKRIALFDTLISNHPVNELVAVLAHEIGHFKKKHIRDGVILSIMELALMFFLMSIFLSRQGLFEAFFVEETSIYVGLVLFSLLYSPLQLILSILLHLWSRKNEYEADRFAAQSINDPEDMVKVLKKLAADNLSNLTPHPFHVFVNYSHPPMLARIKAIRSECST